MSKPKTPDEESTRTLVKEALSTINRDDNRTYEPHDIPEKQSWFDSQLLKILCSLLIFLVPLAITFFVYLSNMDARIKILEDRQGTIVEMKCDIKEMKNDLNQIKIQLGKLGYIYQENTPIAGRE